MKPRHHEAWTGFVVVAGQLKDKMEDTVLPSRVAEQLRRCYLDPTGMSHMASFSIGQHHLPTYVAATAIRTHVLWELDRGTVMRGNSEAAIYSSGASSTGKHIHRRTDAIYVCAADASYPGDRDVESSKSR